MLGRDAVMALMEGKSGAMIGRVDHTNVLTPMRETFEKKKQVDLELVRLLGILAK
jgi:6-phosphofructokinase